MADCDVWFLNRFSRRLDDISMVSFSHGSGLLIPSKHENKSPWSGKKNFSRNIFPSWHMPLGNDVPKARIVTGKSSLKKGDDLLLLTWGTRTIFLSVLLRNKTAFPFFFLRDIETFPFFQLLACRNHLTRHFRDVILIKSWRGLEPEKKDKCESNKMVRPLSE